MRVIGACARSPGFARPHSVLLLHVGGPDVPPGFLAEPHPSNRVNRVQLSSYRWSIFFVNHFFKVRQKHSAARSPGKPKVSLQRSRCRMKYFDACRTPALGADRKGGWWAVVL